MSQTVRSLLVVVVGGAALVFALSRVVESPSFHFPKDFLEYWASGRLNLRGENPYDAKQLLAEQRTADPDHPKAVMMWNPPPSLAVYMPVGLVPARWASLVWQGVQFGATMLACYLLWRVYGVDRVWPGLLAGLASAGTWWVVAYGQNTGLLVLGLAGFLYYVQRGKPLTAGALAALTALKPHLLAGFGVLLLADLLRRRGLFALVTGVSVIAVSLGLAVAANPAVIEQFVAALRDPGPDAIALHDWHLPVPSYWLRVSITGKDIGPDGFWIQFVPCAVACVALLVWRVVAGRAWDWSRAMPPVVAVSVLTTPYGGWVFDLPVLLVPVVWCAARLAHRPPLLVAFLVGQAAITAISFATPGALQNYWWVAPASLALCLLGVCRKQ
jgi:hypothetical protein